MVSSPKEAIASRRAAARAGANSSTAVNDPHALAATTGSGLDQQRQAELRRLGDHLVVGALDRRDDWHACGHRHLPGLVLASHQFHHRRGGAHEDQTSVGARLREFGPLGQEPVAGMDGLRTGRQRRGDHLRE